MKPTTQIKQVPENYCPKCGERWINHNDDGSCVDDAALSDMDKALQWWHGFGLVDKSALAGKYVDVPKIGDALVEHIWRQETQQKPELLYCMQGCENIPSLPGNVSAPVSEEVDISRFLPLFVNESGHPDNGRIQIGSKCDYIAEMYEGIYPHNEPEDNISHDEALALAHRIVTAVNEYDKSREVLQWLWNIVGTANDGGHAWCALRESPGANEWIEKFKKLMEH